MRKRACWSLVGLALVVAALLLTDRLLCEPGLTEDNVCRLRPGMTLAEVTAPSEAPRGLKERAGRFEGARGSGVRSGIPQEPSSVAGPGGDAAGQRVTVAQARGGLGLQGQPVHRDSRTSALLRAGCR
jgi:hypothetical protein